MIFVRKCTTLIHTVRSDAKRRNMALKETTSSCRRFVLVFYHLSLERKIRVFGSASFLMWIRIRIRGSASGNDPDQYPISGSVSWIRIIILDPGHYPGSGPLFWIRISILDPDQYTGSGSVSWIRIIIYPGSGSVS